MSESDFDVSRCFYSCLPSPVTCMVFGYWDALVLSFLFINGRGVHCCMERSGALVYVTFPFSLLLFFLAFGAWRTCHITLPIDSIMGRLPLQDFVQCGMRISLPCVIILLATFEVSIASSWQNLGR